MLGGELSEGAHTAWRALVDAERTGVRSERKDALDAFIASLDGERPEALAAFAEDWCRATFDRPGWPSASHQDGVIFRQPILCKVIWPYLRARYAEGQRRDLLWCASLLQHFRRCPGFDGSALSETTPLDLIIRAWRLDPGDARTAARLRAILLDGIDYNLHELPYLLASVDEIKADIALLRKLGPGEYDTDAFEKHLLATEQILHGDRSEDAIDNWFDSRL